MGRRHRRELLLSRGTLTMGAIRTYVRDVGASGLDRRMTQQWDSTPLAGGRMVQDELSPACSTCGFSLWVPISALSVSHVGLYDDARFPGRMIVSLNEHVEHYDQADPEVLSAFMSDLQVASLVLRKM